MIPKARKKSEADIALQRVKYSKHLFEIKDGIFLTLDTYNDLAEALTRPLKKENRDLLTKGLGSQQITRHSVFRYDNIDPSFDEQMIEHYAKKIEDATKGKTE